MRSDQFPEARCRGLLAWLAVCAAVALVPAGSARAADAGALLQATPLILKDGRIANVSVHVVPFTAGAAQVPTDAARDLAALSREVATDCFLTAQVIGHVGAAEVGEQDTLGAHRLARSRADAVQAQLIARGLPAKSIASVWDWQFMVREARATLWVFRLIPGEDCEGTALDAAGPALVADNLGAEAIAPSPAHAAGSDDATTSERGGPAASVAASTVSRSETAAMSGPAAPEATRAATETATAPAVVQRPALGPAEPSSAEAPRAQLVARPDMPAAAATQPAAVAALTPPPARAPTATPALKPDDPIGAARTRSEPKTAARPDDADTASESATRTTVARADRPSSKPADKRQGAVAASGANTVKITFATNSSYFPPGTGERLRALLDRLQGGQSYDVLLKVTVSGADRVVGATSPEEAHRYNKWLASRRLERVRTWFDKHADGRTLNVKPGYLSDDDSRQVVVRITPTA